MSISETCFWVILGISIPTMSITFAIIEMKFNLTSRVRGFNNLPDRGYIKLLLSVNNIRNLKRYMLGTAITKYRTSRKMYTIIPTKNSKDIHKKYRLLHIHPGMAIEKLFDNLDYPEKDDMAVIRWMSPNDRASIEIEIVDEECPQIVSVRGYSFEMISDLKPEDDREILSITWRGRYYDSVETVILMYKDFG